MFDFSKINPYLLSVSCPLTHISENSVLILQNSSPRVHGYWCQHKAASYGKPANIRALHQKLIPSKYIYYAYSICDQLSLMASVGLKCKSCQTYVKALCRQLVFLQGMKMCRRGYIWIGFYRDSMERLTNVNATSTDFFSVVRGVGILV